LHSPNRSRRPGLSACLPLRRDGLPAFNGTDCRLVHRTVAALPAVVDSLLARRIRPQCRSWRQEGRAACKRCPQIVTADYRASEEQRAVAAPQRSSDSTPLFLRSNEHERTSRQTIDSPRERLMQSRWLSEIKQSAHGEKMGTCARYGSPGSASR
jgi:hypothetical protein